MGRELPADIYTYITEVYRPLFKQNLEDLAALGQVWNSERKRVNCFTGIIIDTIVEGNNCKRVS